MLDKIRIPGCPVRQVTAESRFYVGLFPLFEQGVLWRGGGLADQPYRYVRAMRVIAQRVGEIRRETPPGAPPGAPAMAVTPPRQVPRTPIRRRR